MIALKGVLAPVDDTCFDEICYFSTQNYIGIYDDIKGFILMPKEEIEFSLVLGFPNSLEELDVLVSDKCGERIQAVSTSRCLQIEIVE